MQKTLKFTANTQHHKQEKNHNPRIRTNVSTKLNTVNKFTVK